MHDKIVAGAVRWFGAVSLSLVCGGFAACAGTDTPPVDSDLEAAIAQNFTNGGVGVAGASGSGNAGSGNAPTAGSGGTGDDDDDDVDPPAAGGSSQVPDDEEPPPDDEDPPPGGRGCDGFAILEASCSGGSCHGAGGLGNFAESEEAARAFVGVSGTISCGTAGPLIDPENPGASVIIQKVEPGTPPCGGPMPIGGDALSDEDIQCLEDWIGSL